MNRNRSLSVSVLTQLFRYLESTGTDVRRLMEKTGLDPAVAESPDGRVDISTYIRLEEEAALLSGDAVLGLHVGNHYVTGSWDMLDYIMMNCSTLGDALLKTVRYSKIVSYVIGGYAVFGPGRVTQILTAPKLDPPLSDHCFLTAITSTVRMMRTITGIEISPLKLWTRLPRPGKSAAKEMDDFFRCPVEYASRRHALSLSLSILNTPTLSPNPALLARFEALAEKIISSLDKRGELSEKVCSFIVKSLDKGGPGIRKTADELAMSVRTLQNRLKAEGTVFSELVDTVRRELASGYLQENRTIEEISFMLGFSDTSAFNKGFRRWFGTSPQNYRSRLRKAL